MQCRNEGGGVRRQNRMRFAVLAVKLRFAILASCQVSSPRVAPRQLRPRLADHTPL